MEVFNSRRRLFLPEASRLAVAEPRVAVLWLWRPIAWGTAMGPITAQVEP